MNKNERLGWIQNTLIYSFPFRRFWSSLPWLYFFLPQDQDKCTLHLISFPQIHSQKRICSQTTVLLFTFGQICTKVSFLQKVPLVNVNWFMGTFALKHKCIFQWIYIRGKIQNLIFLNFGISCKALIINGMLTTFKSLFLQMLWIKSFVW